MFGEKRKNYLLDIAFALNSFVANIEQKYVTATLRLARQPGLKQICVIS